MANLQPAEGAGGRRVVIDPITQIEGHLRIEVAMAEDGTVARPRPSAYSPSGSAASAPTTTTSAA